MTIRTGHQYGLPHDSSLAILGKCPIPSGPSGLGSEEGLVFAVEVDAPTAVNQKDRPVYLQLVVKSILALLRHQNEHVFADFDPTVLIMEPVSGLYLWKRLVFRTKPFPYGYFERGFSKLGKRISWAWQIADWVTKVEGTDGHGKAENCPIRPIDVVCRALDGSIAEIVPEELRYEVRRWCECPIGLRDRWLFYNVFGNQLNSEARRWLIDNHFLVYQETEGSPHCFTEKFVLMCWKDAMANLV